MSRVQQEPSREDERAMLAAAMRGEAAAWRWLLAQHGPMVYALCLRLDVDPDDAYQEVWEKICRHLEGFDPDQGDAGSLGAWMRTVTRRHLIDRHRRRQVRGEVLARVEPTHAEALDAEQAVEAQERAARLEAALRRLSPGQRRAVVLHHMEGMALEDIAVSEAAALGTVKSRLHRARAHLARLLGGVL